MTEQEIKAKRARVMALVGAGVAAFVGAYAFGAAKGTVPPLTPAVFVIAGLVCFVAAGRIAKKLTKEVAAK